MSEANEINIVQIQTALLLPVTAQFIEDKLGIKPVRTDKRAKFWTREQFVDICQGIIGQVTHARNANFDAISGQRPKKDEPAAAPAPAAQTNSGAATDFFADGDSTGAADFFNEGGDANETQGFFQ